MKKTLPLLMAGAALLVGSASVQAQYSSDLHPAPPPAPPGEPNYDYGFFFPGPLYVGVDAGGTIMQSMSVKNLGTRVNFDPGARFDLNFGCFVAPQLSAEFETGVIWNTFRKNDSQTLTGADNSGLYQFPLLINLIYHAPLPGGCSLYLGGGAGGVVTTMYVDPGHHHHDDITSDSDVVFAFQGLAGIKIPVARRMAVDVGYKFLGTLDHSWFNDDPGLFTHSGPLYSHSILASFTYSF